VFFDLTTPLMGEPLAPRILIIEETLDACATYTSNVKSSLKPDELKIYHPSFMPAPLNQTPMTVNTAKAVRSNVRTD
jgi:hypothetical protein